METVGQIIGYLFALALFIIKMIFRLIFGLFGIKVFQATSKAPLFDKRQSSRQKARGVSPETFRKGEAFENYVRQHLFTKEKYTVVERTHNYEANKSDFIESTLKADFRFRHNATGNEFFVEAKWRKQLFLEHLEFSKPGQLERYRSYAKELPLYVVIGLGGSANQPDKIFMEHIDKLHSYKIPARDLNRINFHSQREKYKLE